MIKFIEDIAIIGGGPSGAHLGYLLAKNGIYPMIFDHSHPREKPCGGGISAFALEKFSLFREIPKELLPEDEYEGEIISPDGISVMVKGEKPSWTLSRLYFDKFILDKAIDNGSKLIAEQVIDVKLKDNIWEIRTKKGTYKAKMIVGADGVDSIIRKKLLGPIPKQNIGVCYGCFAISKNKEIPRVKFLKKGQGYAWCFPRRDHLSIGVGLESSDSKKIKKLFEEFISSYYPNIEVKSRWGAKIPHIKNPDFYSMPCAGENWILIGDAAGHVDPITGDGITYALWSAELASKAIINDDPSSFDQLWRREYGENLIAGCKMRDTFYNPNLLELSLKIATKSKTLSNVLYNIMQSQQYYRKLFRKTIKIFLKTIKDKLY